MMASPQPSSQAVRITCAIYDNWRDGMDTFDIAGKMAWAWPSLLQRERECLVEKILHRIREERRAVGAQG